ncbi:hypothetical protein Kpol_1062p19 [Vanderwaltozyma polyspora DSM 70294]|uniref:Uncharacterized protein n=1 Tax=Vanderwaltozyma polyspora (strain ATCC 22028 / DSM 70294 / BCRC 21397 / CBS 2163 / NBRC 10782 / NRRL Y-8283 / UCD 57-17) TaxID=436907 RepID=A7TK76_VANPO|nr:uncharacterized protein Kpol_1062p19 [Vanderwaltozyma polyspora DSM 70294]EDO17311.1 hypothetical protein Kpol_1062p19 [Vanderwaltozyma polyspora DSM 70294]
MHPKRPTSTSTSTSTSSVPGHTETYNSQLLNRENHWEIKHVWLSIYTHAQSSQVRSGQVRSQWCQNTTTEQQIAAVALPTCTNIPIHHPCFWGSPPPCPNKNCLMGEIITDLISNNEVTRFQISHVLSLSLGEGEGSGVEWSGVGGGGVPCCHFPVVFSNNAQLCPSPCLPVLGVCMYSLELLYCCILLFIVYCILSHYVQRNNAEKNC